MRTNGACIDEVAPSLRFAPADRFLQRCALSRYYAAMNEIRVYVCSVCSYLHTPHLMYALDFGYLR